METPDPDPDNHPPSYEQSVTSTPPAPNSNPSPSPNLLEARRQQNREIRTRRITDLLATEVTPIVRFRLLDDGTTAGRLIFIIVPSDVLAEERERERLTAKHVVGANTINAAEIGGVVRLRGDEHRSAFWRQDEVVRGLAVLMRRRLASYGYRVEGNMDYDGDAVDGVEGVESGKGKEKAKVEQQQQQASDPNAPAAIPATSSKTENKENKKNQSKERFGFRLKKRSDTSSSSTTGDAAAATPPTNRPTLPSLEDIAVTSLRLGWRADDDEDALLRRKLDPDEARVLAKVKDVSFRTMSLIGLYETVTEKVLWLQIEVGV